MNHTIAGTRLANHQLADTKFTTCRQIALWMGAMQAQDFNMAKWAIGVRIPGCTDKTVMESFNRGEILRTHVMRPTWHLVAPENIRWMLQLTAPRIISSMKSRDAELGVTGEFCARGNRIIEKALQGNNHLTREELGTILQANGIPVDSSRMSHLMMHAELTGLVCSGAMHGKKQTYALLEERVPETKPLARDEALAKLARTYFTGHGPATLQDFVWWSGLSVADARHGLEMAKQEFVSEKAGEQVYWMATASGFFAEDGAVRLLPAFDEYIVGYKDRKAALSAEKRHRVISSNGIFRPVVMKGGQVIGTWKKAVAKDRTMIADLFTNADRKTLKLMDEAEKGLKRFLG
jgi:hypothetical protein